VPRSAPRAQAAPCAVKLIDFGGATYEHEHHSEVVCTRQYRPPEVTLGMHWGCAVDLWSAGCILAELLTGHVLFATHDEAEHLALMERALGAIPRRMARSASERAQRRWFAHGALHWPQVATSRESERHVREAARLKDALARDRPWTRAHDEFLSLLARLLEYLPEHRITAREALLHPFLGMDIAPGVM
jgi:serine/threonine protein kinase